MLEFHFVQGLRAVRTELSFVISLVEKQMPTFELPTSAWTELMKRAADQRHLTIVERLADVYTQILLWNSMGNRLANEPLKNLNPMDGLIGQFCVERRRQLFDTGGLRFMMAIIDEELLLQNVSN